MIARRLPMLLAICVLIPTVIAHSSASDNSLETDEDDQMLSTYQLLDKEDIGDLKNVIDVYRSLDPRFAANVHAPPDRLWKRNANSINTLLGFPRRMLMAGR